MLCQVACAVSARVGQKSELLYGVLHDLALLASDRSGEYLYDNVRKFVGVGRDGGDVTWRIVKQ
jgi:hypothetical protein